MMITFFGHDVDITSAVGDPIYQKFKLNSLSLEMDLSYLFIQFRLDV